jgi:cation diffusion facilitator family transporter
MHSEKQENGGRIIRSVTYLSVLMNVGLSIAKLVVGFLIGSLALIADGIHSLSDLATDGAVLLGLHFGSKEPDKSHPYGHGRIETFSAGLIALVLVVVGGAMIYYASISLARDDTTCPHIAMGIAALISIAAKEWLYRITKRAAVQSHSSALYANAWHHRSDALSSIAVVIGFIAMKFGFTHGDQVAAISVGLMIIWVGVRIIGDALRELTEGAIDANTIEEIKNIINADASIRQWHQLRTRRVGREVFLDLHILVAPDLNVAAAHEISERLENTLHEQIPRPINIVVHIEPDVPELRK